MWTDLASHSSTTATITCGFLTHSLPTILSTHPLTAPTPTLVNSPRMTADKQCARRIGAFKGELSFLSFMGTLSTSSMIRATDDVRVEDRRDGTSERIDMRGTTVDGEYAHVFNTLCAHVRNSSNQAAGAPLSRVMTDGVDRTRSARSRVGGSARSWRERFLNAGRQGQKQ